MRRGWLLPGALAALAAGGMARAVAVEGPQPDADPERGRGVVVGTYARDPAGACFRCHGMDGAGQAEAAYPRLSGQYDDYLHAALEDYAEGRRSSAVMEPIAKALTGQEKRDVAAYYAASRNAPYPALADGDPALLDQGKGIAELGAPDQGVSPCSNCHGTEGVGMPPDFPFLGGQHASYIEQQLLLWKRGGRHSDESGIMERIASRLSYGQIRAVSAYYGSLRPTAVAPAPGAGAGTAFEVGEGQR